jgi:single-stranded-DNA-specific exonuclease
LLRKQTFKILSKRWNIQKHNRAEAENLARELQVAPVVAALLMARGYDDAEAAYKFLNPSFEQLHEPTLLRGINVAADRIFRAIDGNEKILIWGDYDVDGTTGTVVLRKALEILGAKTGFHVPHRFTEGYGLNIPALEKAKAEGFSLVITVDCGITAFEPIAWAQANGLDVIVTDHHLTREGNLPAALSVVNPNQAECPYPDKNLAGVGVAFKLAHALLRERGRENLVKSFLKVVAIGTIADIMNLTGENRAIVSLGLRDLPLAKNHGLRALMETAACTSQMTAYDIGFRLAPRINAAGRMDAARAVVELFEAPDFDRARVLAEHLDSRNRERQTIQKQITELALGEIPQSADNPHFVVVAGEGWHRGVIGLAASKIAEKLHRPAIVISLENGVGHGSARSIKPYHLLDGLDSCADLFEQYGGHAQAAGMKIKAENVAELRQKLNEHCASCLRAEDFIPEIRVDAQLSAASLNLDLVRELKRLEPFGAGNPRPIFATGDLILQGEPLVMKEKHLKLRLVDRERRQFEAVWWNGVEASKNQNLRPRTKVEIAYAPEINVWQGNTRLQLVIEDLRES